MDTTKKSITDQADAALNALASDLEAGNSESLTRWLEAQAKFHKYSWTNTLLISWQRPTATNVAGFHRWKELDRCVRKGEKGIGILAPLVGKRKDTDDETTEPQIYGFRTVYVFDVEQTDGKPLPEFAEVTGDTEDLTAKLRAWITSRGIKIEYKELPLDNGGSSSGGMIEINDRTSAARQFGTLCHEVAHEILHWESGRRSGLTVTQRETEAEAVSYVVCRSAGLDCGTRSVDYIKLYNGDSKTLGESLQHIRAAAMQILEGIGVAD